MVRHFGKEPFSKFAIHLDINGAGDRNRTGDPVITSDVLYQLSYTSPSVPHVTQILRVKEPEDATMVRPPRIELGTP